MNNTTADFYCLNTTLLAFLRSCLPQSKIVDLFYVPRDNRCSLHRCFVLIFDSFDTILLQKLFIFRTFNIFRDYFQDFFYRFFQDLFCSGKGVSRSYLQFPRLRNKWTLVSGLCCGQDSGTVFSGLFISGLIPIFIRISFDFRLVSDCVKHIPAPQL